MNTQNDLLAGVLLISAGLLGALNRSDSTTPPGIRPTDLSGASAAIKQMGIPANRLGGPVNNRDGVYTCPVRALDGTKQSPFNITVAESPDGKVLNTIQVGSGTVADKYWRLVPQIIDSALQHAEQEPLAVFQSPYTNIQAIVVTGPAGSAPKYAGQALTDLHVHFINSNGTSTESAWVGGYVANRYGHVQDFSNRSLRNTNIAHMNYVAPDSEATHSVTFALEPDDNSQAVWRDVREVDGVERLGKPQGRVLSALGDTEAFKALIRDPSSAP